MFPTLWSKFPTIEDIRINETLIKTLILFSFEKERLPSLYNLKLFRKDEQNISLIELLAEIMWLVFYLEFYA